MNVKQNKTFAAYVAAAVVTAGFAISPVNAKEADPIGPKLTPRLKQMLSEEMLSVRLGFKDHEEPCGNA